jgi:hypothetical protein
MKCLIFSLFLLAGFCSGFSKRPTSAPSTVLSHLGRPYCNICGEGTQNIIGQPKAVVNFPDPDDTNTPPKFLRFPCSETQILVNTKNIYKRADVCSFLFHYTYSTCRCETPNGQQLNDVLAPTLSPAQGGAPASPAFVRAPSPSSGTTPTGGSSPTSGSSPTNGSPPAPTVSSSSSPKKSSARASTSLTMLSALAMSFVAAVGVYFW